MFQNYFSGFSQFQICTLTLTFIFFLFACSFFISNKKVLSGVFLFLAGISLYSFAITLDPFLNLWDERFHALVGKNLMSHMLKPTFYDNPIMDMSYDTWDKAYIWLHKQPLFLWQIALSFNFFGISEYTLRIPSALLGAIFVVITYRSGRILVNSQTGFIAGILALTSIYNLELIAGRFTTDHNDLSFMVYISMSLWSLIEYINSNKKFWIILIGVFSGMAILCKWLVGLLVFLTWIFYKLYQRKTTIRDFRDLSSGLLTSVMVFVPWQVYSFLEYPIETKLSHEFNFLHISMAVEGHGGSFWYHFLLFDKLFGSYTSFIILPSIVVFYFVVKNKKLALALISSMVFVYLFYPLVETKMGSFTIINSLIIFISFGAILDKLVYSISQYLSVKFIDKILFVLTIVAVVIFRFDVNYLRNNHTNSNKNYYLSSHLHNKRLFNDLELPRNTVLCNVLGGYYIDAMFYLDIPAYNFIPSFNQYIDLKEKGMRIAIFRDGRNELPKYITDDSSSIIIEDELLPH